MKSSRCIPFLLVAMILAGASASAAPPRVFPEGKLPEDRRLASPKDYDGYFPWTPPNSIDEWNVRAERVRRQMLVALGLWPMPTKTPLNAVIHGRIERPDYTVEKVYFESYPGFFVTGNLYRPKNVQSKVPAVLVPHGHHANGRFNEEAVATVRNQIAEGAERFVNGGMHPLQAMSMELARMGCVAFHYDMVGYADSTQLSFELVHRYGKERLELDKPEGWGFFTTQAELRCQSPMGLQSYNAIRALDFVSELPEVDATRIGVTGASGGGTQTMIIAALDPRVTAAVPAVMVSTSMQGGCTCENASLLRVDTGNIEFAALYAPKPQCLICANDWTKELATKGLPELQQHYKLFGAPDNLIAKINVQFPHNYNYVSREAMYQWFNKYLKLGLPSPVLEEDFQPLTTAEMSVWDNDHPKPPSGDDYERLLTKWQADDAAKQLAALTPKDATTLAEYRRVAGGAFDVILGQRKLAKEDLQATVTEAIDLGPYFAVPGVLRQKANGAELPFLMLAPDKLDVHRYVLWIDEAGKSGLFAEDGQPKAEVKKLLDAGFAVIGADLILQGEFLADGQSPAVLRRVPNPREFLGYTLGYNYAPFAQRVQDVLSLASNLRLNEFEKDDQLYVVGFDGAGKWVAGALAIAGDKAFDRAVVDTGGFRFANLSTMWSIDMLPGTVKYGDVPGMLSLAAPTSLWIAGEGSSAPAIVNATYQAAGKADAVTMFEGPADQKRAAAIDWLLKP